MSGIFTRMHSFRRGCLGKNGRILFLLINDELARGNNPHTCVVMWNSGRFYPITTTGWTACSAVYLDWIEAEFVVVGENRQLLKIREDFSYVEETISLGDTGSAAVFRGASNINGNLAVAGTGLYCGVLSADNAYRDISPRLFGQETEGAGLGFEAIDGLSLDNIVAVGWSGAIWCFDGKNWALQSSPTNLILSDVVCLPDGETWMCGQHGTVVRGRSGEWHALDTGLTQNLWSLTPYAQGILVACSVELFRFDKDSEAPLSIGFNGDPKSFYWLDSKNDDVLLSTGAKNVVLLVPDREIIID